MRYLKKNNYFVNFTASGEDPQCSTPKSRKNESYSQGHLAPPSASPGAHAHEDFEMGSPTWSRTPASPVSLKRKTFIFVVIPFFFFK